MMTDDRQPRTQWCGETMTAPMTSREELPTDEVTLADFIYSVRGYGDAVAKAKLLWPMLSIAEASWDAAHWKERHDTVLQKHIECCGDPAQGAPQGWKLVPIEPTQEMIGAAEDAREAYAGYAFRDVYAEMVNAAPASSPPSTGLPAPAPHAEVREKTAIWEAVEANVRERIAEGDGFWRTCSGCYETEDGYPNGHYPHSAAFGCTLGGGCSECGGIGAIWDTTDYAAMGEELSRSPQQDRSGK